MMLRIFEFYGRLYVSDTKKPDKTFPLLDICVFDKSHPGSPVLRFPVRDVIRSDFYMEVAADKLHRRKQRGRDDAQLIASVKSGVTLQYDLYLSLEAVGCMLVGPEYQIIGDIPRMGAGWHQRRVVEKWHLADDFTSCKIVKHWNDEWREVNAALERAEHKVETAIDESDLEATFACIRRAWEEKHKLLEVIANYTIDDFLEEKENIC